MKNLIWLTPLLFVFFSCNQSSETHVDAHEAFELPFTVKTEFVTGLNKDLFVQVTVTPNDIDKTYYPGYFDTSMIENDTDFVGDLFMVNEKTEFNYKVKEKDGKNITIFKLPIENNVASEQAHIAIFLESMEYVEELINNKRHRLGHIRNNHVHTNIPNWE